MAAPVVYREKWSGGGVTSGPSVVVGWEVRRVTGQVKEDEELNVPEMNVRRSLSQP